MNAQTESPIRTYARLHLMAQRYRASGVPIPHAVQQQMQALETWGHSALTPEEGQRMMQMVHAEQQALLAQESQEVGMLGQLQRSREEILSEALRNSGSKRVSQVANLDRDGKGLNEQQLSDAAFHGKYVTPGKQRDADVRLRQMSERMGRNVSPAEYKATLAKLSELHDNPKMMERYVAAQHPDDIVSQKALERQIKTTVIAAGIAERRDRNAPAEAFEPKVIELTPEERRRLDLSDRIIAHNGPEFFIEEIHDIGEPGSIRAALVDAVEASHQTDPDVAVAAADLDEVNQALEGR